MKLIPLTDEESTALIQLARAERRHPRDQAALLVRLWGTMMSGKEDSLKIWQVEAAFGEKAAMDVLGNPAWQLRYPDQAPRWASKDLVARSRVDLPMDVVIAILQEESRTVDFFVTRDRRLLHGYARYQNPKDSAVSEIRNWDVSPILPADAIREFGALAVFEAGEYGLGYKQER